MNATQTIKGKTMNDHEIHHVPLESPPVNLGIAGYYLSFRSDDPSDWTWTDRGNGPEIVEDGVYGPFETEAVAEEYARGLAKGSE